MYITESADIRCLIYRQLHGSVLMMHCHRHMLYRAADMGAAQKQSFRIFQAGYRLAFDRALGLAICLLCEPPLFLLLFVTMLLIAFFCVPN